MPDFLSWQRPAVYALATAPRVGARLGASLPITLHDDVGDVPAAAPFLLAGPADVARFTPGQVIGRHPHPGRVDAESTMMPYVELRASDLPWRYSPDPHVAGASGVRPWLVLVVGSPTEVQLQPDGQVILTGPDVFTGHRLADSFRWAHVHEAPGRTFARVLSPRPLNLAQDYVAALVPGWCAKTAADGSVTVVDSWTDGTTSATLPCFDSWTFRTTADAGDFASVATRLEPLAPAEAALLEAAQFGRAMVKVGPLAGARLAAGGALTVVPDPGSPPVIDPLLPDVADAVQKLSADLDIGGRWVLTLPRYDAPWYPSPVDGQAWAWPPPTDDVVPDGWRRQLRADPRYRGAAGLGGWLGIAWQDRISDGAVAQAGAVAAAAQRIRHLVLGLRGSASLWNRRVPVDPLARLATVSPLLGRMPVTIGGTALQAIGGRTHALAPALFSSAARRMLRRRGPLARSAAPGATSLAALIAAANHCPPPQKLPDADAKVAESATQKPEALAGALRQQSQSVLQKLYEGIGDPAQNADTAGRLAESLLQAGVAEELVAIAAQQPPVVNCRPLPDLNAFADSIAAGIDPTAARPMVVERVLGGLIGLREPVLAEPDLAPEIDIPLWSFVKDNAPDWLLPGAGDIPTDRVLAVQSNPAFIEALLLGANYQTLGELRWRNLPITSRWTPLRRFWQRIDLAKGAVATDIRSIVALDTDLPLWPDGTDLGDVSHLSDPTHGAALVIVLHTELFRRYPSTAVYLTPNAGGEITWGSVPTVDGDPGAAPPVAPAERRYPSFSGTFDPDLVFFGFDVPPAAGRSHWVVLEEPPPGYQFLRPGADGSPLIAPADAATFASATFRPPTRVFFGNLL